jgi:uracil-DNA glycosylase family 4
LPGPDAPVLIVIGPTPGYHEHVHSEPFVGKPGRLLRDILLADLSTLCTIYGTYLARCGPEPDAKARDYKACFSFHDSDFRSILDAHTGSQIHVLLLGADAAAQFHRLHLGSRCSHKDAIARNGKPHQIAGRTIPVFTTLHPAAILRNNSLIYTVEDHIELLSSTIRGCAPVPTDPDIQPPRPPHH